MKGILLISHGKMAEGTVNTCNFVMGESLTQLDSCCLEDGEAPEHYGKRLKEKLESVDSGDGVIVFCDLYGGTPCKEAIVLINEKNDLIAGMNFPMILEALTERISGDVKIDDILAVARTNISNVKSSINAVQFDEGDE